MANTFTTFTLSTSESSGVHTNTHYPHIRKITNLQSFQKATNYDHCVGRFTDDKRTKTNFVSADCIFLDIDNDSLKFMDGCMQYIDLNCVLVLGFKVLWRKTTTNRYYISTNTESQIIKEVQKQTIIHV